MKINASEIHACYSQSLVLLWKKKRTILRIGTIMHFSSLFTVFSDTNGPTTPSVPLTEVVSVGFCLQSKTSMDILQ